MESTKGLERLIHDIESETLLTQGATGRPSLDPRVMEAMRCVPRQEFVPEELRRLAYQNGPLSIGHAQTISQPFIVALMTDLLRTRPDSVILEVGTGSGYQAAVLASLVRQVYSVEIIPALARLAAERLARLSYRNVEVRVGNGALGWPEHAPYDGIIVTAAATHIPQSLVDQLRPGARLVIPVGLPYMAQELMVVDKDRDGNTQVNGVLAVSFVPLTGEID